jgi:hypothetical protein
MLCPVNGGRIQQQKGVEVKEFHFTPPDVLEFIK